MMSVFFCSGEKRENRKHTVVSDNINIMKTTFELNFDLYQAFKQHGLDTHKYENKEQLSI